MVRPANGVKSSDLPPTLDEVIIGVPEFTVAGVYHNYFGIHTFGVNTGFTITADILQDDNDYLAEGMMLNFILLEVEYAADGKYTIISSPRVMGNVSGNKVLLSVPDGIPKSGNYLISMARQNQGIAYLGLPFEIVFNDVELDICLNL